MELGTELSASLRAAPPQAAAGAAAALAEGRAAELRGGEAAAAALLCEAAKLDLSEEQVRAAALQRAWASGRPRTTRRRRGREPGCRLGSSEVVWMPWQSAGNRHFRLLTRPISKLCVSMPQSEMPPI